MTFLGIPWRSLRGSALALPVLLVMGQHAPGGGAEPTPTPQAVLGFPLGQDRTLADWNQIVGYLRRLDEASPRVRLETVGVTTEGRPFLVAAISSARNLERLEQIRQDHLRLADPRGLDDAEAARLLDRGRMVMVLTHGIHSTEVAGPHTAVETAWLLASTQEPELVDALEETVVLLVPSQNPDGTQKVTEWYRQTLGTPYEGSNCENTCRLPFLYHHYVGHDNNRDWYAFTQQETRLALEHVLRRWHPVLLHDVHQMGSRGPRLFVPPYMDPWEPNVDPALRMGSSAVGMHVAARLTAQGKTGVAVQSLFDAWAPARAYPVTHGGLRILSETAGGRLGTPLEVARESLEPGPGVDPRAASWNFPAPWPGGLWRLRDQMDYQLAATRAMLAYTSRHRRQMLGTFLEVNRRASQARAPWAYVVPSEQRDRAVAARLLRILRDGEVELRRTRAPLAVAGRMVAAGAHLVPLDQPASAFAATVLERQRYPDLRLTPGGVPRRPYDATAHTLPLLMGVEVLAADGPLTVDSAPVASVDVPSGVVRAGRGRFLALPHTVSGFMAAARLLRESVPLRWAVAPIAQEGGSVPAGALLAPATARARVSALARELALDVRPVRAAPADSMPMRLPRVGLYQSWVPSMDEGWTRFVLEKQLELPYSTLHDADVRGGSLRERLDVIVLPDQAAAALLEGNPADSLPPQYTGGLGAAGVAALRAFVEEGGTLVAIDSACRFAIEQLQLPIRDAVWQWTRPGKRVAPEAPAEQGATEFYAPGSLLEALPAADSPLVQGAEAFAVWYESSPAFAAEGDRARILLRYPPRNPLLSGWLIGPERIQGLGALAEVPMGRGRVVLFGFRPQYRAQSWGTYVLLLNALFSSAVDRVDSIPAVKPSQGT